MNAPTLTGAPGDRQVTLQIGRPPDAVRVRVRMASGSSGWSTVYDGSASSATVTGLTNGQAYRFKGRGIDAKGKVGPFSQPDLVLTPAAPTVRPIGGFARGIIGGGDTVTHVIDAGGG